MNDTINAVLLVAGLSVLLWPIAYAVHSLRKLAAKRQQACEPKPETGVTLDMEQSSQKIEQMPDGSLLGEAIFRDNPGFAALCAEFGNIMTKANAPNYLQMEIKPKGMVNGYVLLIQKPGGETPAQQNTRLRAEIEKLRSGTFKSIEQLAFPNADDDGKTLRDMDDT